jgi:hypothetical protein
MIADVRPVASPTSEVLGLSPKTSSYTLRSVDAG